MISNYTILAIPQWAIFASVTMMAYGWSEKKRIFGLLGTGILVLTALFAAWVLYAGLLMPEDTIFNSGAEAGGDAGLTPAEMPAGLRLVPFYYGLVANGLVAAGAATAALMRKKQASVLKIIAGGIAILLFFGMLSAART